MTEIVTLDVISLHTSIRLEFSLDCLDYFVATYKEELHTRFKRELVF